jgi:DMSO reductase anchor subunit
VVVVVGRVVVVVVGTTDVIDDVVAFEEHPITDAIKIRLVTRKTILYLLSICLPLFCIYLYAINYYCTTTICFLLFFINLFCSEFMGRGNVFIYIP